MSVVFELMKKNPITINPDETAVEAARLMSRSAVGVLIVISDGKLSGILSERDIVSKVVADGKDPAHIQVRDIMVKNPITVTPETSVEECIDHYLLTGFRHLPVLTKDGRIQGMLSSRDFLPHMKNTLGKVMDEKNYKQFISDLESITTQE